jgi:FdrA protein
MPVLTSVKPSEYHDSVTLMRVAKVLLEVPGVQDAAVVMGTPANRDIIASAGLLTPDANAARPDDLLIVVKATDQASALAALTRAEEALAAKATAAEAGATTRPRSLVSAIATAPDANLAVVSVAGRYAAREARTALERGLHVLLFSDNVTLEEEIALKKLALDRGLLCMGPDAGTAIINGIALGFANALPRGNVGLVSASGTGLQGVTCGMARAGAGVSQAIGVGSRDLSKPVGGAMMIEGLRALQKDPETGVIVLISKPPAALVADTVLAQVGTCAKPTVACFLGAAPAPIEAAGAFPAANLTQAAIIAAALARCKDPTEAVKDLEVADAALIQVARAERARLAPSQHALRGLFAGGTFCYEAQLVLKDLPQPVRSNAPLLKENRLVDPNVSTGHVCIDLGEDEFTQGRLHPMIDPTLRNRRIVQEARDPATAVILLDVVLGYGAHPSPASAAGEAIRQAQCIAEEAGRHIAFVASVCGTEADPQVLSRQEAILREAGVIVLPVADNASAARLAGLITQAPHE